MGKITELRQGNLEGLKKQVCECIDHAHEQGYKQGFINCKKSYPFTEEEVNKVANDEYNKGYADGKKEPIESHGEQEYNRGIKDASYLLAYADERFIRECFPSESNWNLFDLNAKYGLAVVIKKFKKWLEQEKQAEEEIKVGDEVKDRFTDNIGVVMAIGELIVYITKNGVYINALGSLEKTGRHFDEVGQLLDKLKGDK